ncbi:hypothetical protein K5I29_05585 [Flavobacterium agricola]|uniref:SH3 domain-containing protein n=1 Tax=Flavobacterium agricola TaxID=2870839 RepID=A0ABY6M1F6_9FLAO|nr:hypothetical protein [Flavobacterium agricola]UYW02366.1 hypothetical protein K5I29_05585 [Flavobacterium agricola]
MKKTFTLIALIISFIFFAQVGIGTTTPESMLHIVSKTPGAIIIEDSSHGQNRILTSDENGKAGWVEPRKTVFGSYPNQNQEKNIRGGNTLYTEAYLELSKGKWLVNIGVEISNTTSLLVSRVPFIVSISDEISKKSNENYKYLGNSDTNRIIPGVIYNPNTALLLTTVTGFFSGPILIEVIEPTAIYLKIENKGSNDIKYNTKANENYFYAIPIN